ncbi:hypothetical protein ACVGWA_00370, partial [Enterobacter hormaechei]
HDLDATVVFGVNQHELQAEHRIVSNPSCNTNCINSVIKQLYDAYGNESGTVTTIHSAMHDHQVFDANHPDLTPTRCLLYKNDPADHLIKVYIYIDPVSLKNSFAPAWAGTPVWVLSLIDLCRCGRTNTSVDLAGPRIIKKGG